MSPSILFSSYHSYLDWTSGAARATRATLHALARAGWKVRALCGSFLDSTTADEREFVKTIQSVCANPKVSSGRCVVQGVSTKFRVFQFDDEGIEATLLLTAGAFSEAVPRYFLSKPSGDVFLSLLSTELSQRPVDVYATYGGYWAASLAATLAKERGARRVFMLHNFSYENRELFERFDRVVVPSQFARRFYFDRLGVRCDVVPPIGRRPLPPKSPVERQYATLVNPAVEKGAFFFLGLARELNQRRPDVRLLAVESRATCEQFRNAPDVAKLRNLYKVERAPNLDLVYASSKMTLLPSLWNESFGLTALESALAGAPVLCSDRGATKECVDEEGNSPLVLHIPPRFVQNVPIIPTAEEVEPWVEQVVKIWDDPAYAQAQLESQRKCAERFAPERAAERNVEFFNSLL